MASNVKIEQYVTSKSNDEQKLRDKIKSEWKAKKTTALTLSIYLKCKIK